jgi:hypothetical protein
MAPAITVRTKHVVRIVSSALIAGDCPMAPRGLSFATGINDEYGAAGV